MRRGFTLIELLVVITILGVLVTLILVTINPAEAQRKARDAQRLKDMATVQSIVEQYLADNPGAFPAGYPANKDTSVSNASSCSTGWLQQALGGSVCAYANVIPTDPVNRSTQLTKRDGTVETATATYYIRFSGGAYKICTRLESTSNKNKLAGDGEATANDVFAIFSTDIVCP